MYVQDDATPHTACETIAFLAQQDVEVKGWPVQSPDMNLSEHVWYQTGVWLRDMDALPALLLCKAWGAVRPRRARTLVESLPRCVRALLSARGGGGGGGGGGGPQGISGVVTWL